MAARKFAEYARTRIREDMVHLREEIAGAPPAGADAHVNRYDRL
ncbi:hypothetical protein [Mycobacterium sp.]